MASINKVIIIGTLGRDPEIRYTPSGSAVANLSIATSRNWKDKTSGERVQETDWHRVVLFDRLAEIAGEFVKKGRQIYIEGRLKTKKWTDKQGVDHYTTEIMGESLQLISPKDDSAPPPQAQTQRQPANQPATTSGTGFDGMDDEIPF